MKNSIFTSSCWLLFLVLFTGCNKDDTNVLYPEIDTELYNYLLEKFDSNKDGIISTEEANRVNEITINGLRITSFRGIELFPNLEKLFLVDLIYTGDGNCDLDLSKNTALTELSTAGMFCFRNVNITKCPLLRVLRLNQACLYDLDVSKNTQLEILELSPSNLSSLELGNNIHLKKLDVSSNFNITSLDVSKNTELEIVDISDNKITGLDISKNVALKEFYCNNNHNNPGMNELDVSKNTLLEVLNLRGSNLTKIDLTNNPKLSRLDLSKNDNIVYLNITQNNQLKNLNISNSAISNLDIKNTQIDTLLCYATKGLKSLDAKGSKSLKFLGCHLVEHLDLSESSIETILFRDSTSNSIPYVPFSEMTVLLNNCPNLKGYYYNLNSRNYPKINLDISNCPLLATFFSIDLKSIGIKNCPQLKEITCSGDFEDFDLSNNSNIESVYSHSPLLNTIDLSACISLRNLNCMGKFETVNLTNNKNIERLELKVGQLNSLDLSLQTKLKHLDVAFFMYSASLNLNLSKNVELEDITIRDTSINYVYNKGDVRLFIENLPSIKFVNGFSAAITEIKVNNCANLEYMNGGRGNTYDGIKSHGLLDIENCPKLRTVYFSEFYLTDVRISECNNLDSLTIIYNPTLASFQYEGKSLSYLHCTENKLPSLDLSNSTGLKKLICNNNEMSSLNIIGCNSLELVDCSDNNLPALSVDGFSKLKELYCNRNQLQTLDISNNLLMDKLDCTDNPNLTTLFLRKTQNFSLFKKDNQTQLEYTD